MYVCTYIHNRVLSEDLYLGETSVNHRYNGSGQAGTPFCSLSVWEGGINQSYKTSCNVKVIVVSNQRVKQDEMFL